MFTVQQIIDLQEIIDTDSTIELIEIWDNVLYVRRNVGRCSFMKKPESLKNNKEYQIYINLKKGSDYVRQLLFKFHPDRSKSKCSAEITACLLEWREFLSRHNIRDANMQNTFELISKLLREYAILLSETRICYGKWPEDRFCNQYTVIVETEADRQARIDGAAEIDALMERRLNPSKKVGNNSGRRKERSVRI